MNNVDFTEIKAVEFLLSVARNLGEVSPRCVVMTRTQEKNSLLRKVRLALIVSANNTALIDSLIIKCLDLENDVFFIGSEVNLQSDLEIDYLYFETSVFAKK